MWWNSNDGTMYVYYKDADAYQWVEVRSQVAKSQVGLVPVTPGSVTVATGTATVNGSGLVTFTGASYIQLGNVFTSSYKSYRILAKWDVASGTQYITMTSVTNGTNNTTSNWYSFSGLQSYGAGTIGGWQITDPGSWWLGQTSASVPGLNQSAIEVHNNPAAVDRKGLSWITTEYNDSSGYRTIVSGGTYRSVSAFDGFRITPSGSTISGTIQVYGYNN